MPTLRQVLLPCVPGRFGGMPTAGLSQCARYAYRAVAFCDAAVAWCKLAPAVGVWNGKGVPGRMSGETIYHICRRTEWEAARELGYYAGSSQDQEDGFIHFSTAGQVIASAAKHRAGQTDLLLVAVDAALLGPALRWEASRDGVLFPHLHGELLMSAVCWTKPLPLGVDSRHVFPPLEGC